jgi:hypothetical protein
MPFRPNFAASGAQSKYSEVARLLRASRRKDPVGSLQRVRRFPQLFACSGNEPAGL